MNSIKQIEKTDILAAAAGSLYFCFTLLTAGPIFLLCTNIKELWFDLFTIIPVMIVVDIAVFIILILIWFLLYRIKKTAARVFCTVIFIISFCYYIQGNFIGCDYGQLNGDEILWDTFRLYAAESIALWIGIPVIIAALIKWKGYKKIIKGAAYLALLTVMMQAVALVTVIYTSSAYKEKDMRLVTTDSLNEYSTGKNVVVLVFDALDTGLFTREIEENPESAEVFRDFTYYPDTSGMYQNTKCSVPYILTGIPYKNEETYDDYIERSYSETELYDELERSDFSTGIYCSGMYVSPEMEGKAVNMHINRKVPSSYPGIAKLLYQLVLFRYSPHQFKKYFWLYSGDFNKYASTGGEYYELYPEEEFSKAHEMIINRPIELTGGKNTFKYIHTRGVHRPFECDSDFNSLSDGQEVTIEDMTKACFKFAEEYIDKLKEAGVYDNTALIVTADHGCIYYHQNPILLFKDYGHHGEFEISDKPLSFEDLMPAFRSMIQSDRTTVFEDADPDRVRPFYFYEWNTRIQNWLPPIKYFEIHGNATDIDSLIETDVTYKPKNEIGKGIYTFEGDDTIIFDDSDKCNSIIKVGVSSYIDNEWGVKKRWSNAPISEFQINVPEAFDKDIHVYITADTEDKQSQHVEISANNNKIDDIQFSGGTFDFVIPSEYAEDGVIGLKLAYPDRDIEFGVRGITLHFSEMKLKAE